MVNGPEDVHLDWEAVDWRLHEENVRRLRQRIFKAAQEQDWPKVVHRDASSWRPRPVKRVYRPKAGNRAKLRPLGIPVIMDRCHQGRVRNALEPEWESRFEPKSYGFRPGRSCQDAISAIFNICRGSRAKRVWALDADLAAAFDRIDHSRLLEALGSFPARDLIWEWLKAGVFEKGKGFAPTEEGTPQGGVISPLLLNIALHGAGEGRRSPLSPGCRCSRR
ncbi:reverse transcriptase domain-containing protein [Nonomuraea jabiensis]|uniref:RNA-directed DNA polymerase n=1 Tax=Nonomuraea jabiensis TaxID=882448 RepID=A0A7W9GE16_9ACTN|nr:reverse transcriptase domain-containing protein [Nonomuraea jabiensis]MBB5782094.1 RNA-directed DNA polymerase [Nonomuraea jabiensis]